MSGCRWNSGCWLGTSGLHEEKIGISKQYRGPMIPSPE